MAVDYYAVLQLRPDATAEEVHHAYRALALRYHPDRNQIPEAAATMARINEAYEVLGEPARRRRYDRELRLSCSSDLTMPIVAGARDTLLRQRWTILRDDGNDFVLESGSRHVRVCIVEKLTNLLLRKLSRQYTGFAVVLAVELETPLNLSLQVAVIDLVHSTHTGAAFPDDAYRALFAPFLAR